MTRWTRRARPFRTGEDEYRVFLSGGENFRKIIYPEYKANRTQVPPRNLGACQELYNEWGARFAHGYEADDAIGMAHDDNTIICSIDKDLKQLPGEHYNFVTYVFDVIDEDTAELNFWTQMLVGDSSDNVPGIPKIGPVKAKRILDGMSITQMHDTVKEMYNDDEMFLRNFRLLRILRNPVEYENILKEIENKNGISEEQGTDSPEDSGTEDLGEVSESDAR